MRSASHEPRQNENESEKESHTFVLVVSIINRLRNACQTIVPLIETCCFLKRSFFSCCFFCSLREIVWILCNGNEMYSSGERNNHQQQQQQCCMVFVSLRSFNSHGNCLLEFLCIIWNETMCYIIPSRNDAHPKKTKKRRRRKSKWFFHDAELTEASVQCIKMC